MVSSHNLIFLHGWGTGPSVWKYQVEYFSKKYNVEAINLPSHGGNGHLSPVACHLSKTDDWRPATILIGWSYGGMFAIKNVALTPEKFKALVLVGCSPKFVDENFGMKLSIIKKLRRDLKRNFEETMKNCYKTFFSKEESNFANEFINKEIPPTKKIAIDILDELINLDLRDVVKEINLPLLIIHGDKDEVCPLDAGEFLHKHIKSSRFKVIKGAGHIPFYTRPDEFNKILEDFLLNDIK